MVRKSSDFTKKDGISIEIHDLSEKGPLPSHRGDLSSAPAGFDFERLVRFMAWGMYFEPTNINKIKLNRMTTRQVFSWRLYRLHGSVFSQRFSPLRQKVKLVLPYVVLLSTNWFSPLYVNTIH